MFNHETSIPAVTKMFPSRVEDPMVRADILIQTFREISGLSEQSMESKNRLLQKIEKNYRVIDRLRSLQNAGIFLHNLVLLSFYLIFHVKVGSSL